MSVALQPTLGELRHETLNRCGLATEGNVPRTIQDIIDSRIRSAQKQLYELFPWLATYVTGTITLANGVGDYDIPDDTEPGKITFVALNRISDGWVVELERGIRPAEMNYYAQAMTKGSMPLRFDFIDNVLRIAPVPDTTYYDVLKIAYFQTPPKMVEDSERAVVDGEALLMLTEILVKEHFGGQATEKLAAALDRYVDRVKMKQSNGEGFQMGGHQSLVGKTQKRNRFAWSGIQANTWRDWRPW
jgi:hypothetical protein